MNRRLSLLAALLAPAHLALAYLHGGPVTNRPAAVATQDPTDARFLLLERERNGLDFVAVLHSRDGSEEPRVLRPFHPDEASIRVAARRAMPDGSEMVLVNGCAATCRWRLSRDGGASWSDVGLASVGDGKARLGSAAYPFLVENRGLAATGVYAIRSDGAPLPLTESFDASRPVELLGGAEDLAIAVVGQRASTGPGLDVSVVAPGVPARLVGSVPPKDVVNGVPLFPAIAAYADARGEVYLRVANSCGFLGSTVSEPCSGVAPRRGGSAFLVFRSVGDRVVAHVVESGGVPRPEVPLEGLGTSLVGFLPFPSGRCLLATGEYRTGMTGLEDQWEDSPSARIALWLWDPDRDAPPARLGEVEAALHTAFVFASISEDSVARGEPFVLDTGNFLGGGPSVPYSFGYSEAWNVLRLRLQQRLVVPAAARVTGVGGIEWRSDLVLRNPGASGLPATLRFQGSERLVDLLPGETKRLRDVVGTLFGLERAFGPVFIDVPAGREIQATSRTRAETASGAVSMLVPARPVDAAALGSRLDAWFPGALAEENVRTNVLLSDLDGRGADAIVSGERSFGMTLAAGAGASQASDVGAALGRRPPRVEVLRGRPSAGAIAIDAATSDPTWHEPGVSSGTAREVLAASTPWRGANWRTEVSFVNPLPVVQEVKVGVFPFENGRTEIKHLSLGANESLTFRDVLGELFGLDGFAVLRVFGTTRGPRGGEPVWSSRLVAGGIRGDLGTSLQPIGAENANLSSPPALGTTSEVVEILLPENDPAVEVDLFLRPLAWSSGTRVELVNERGETTDRFVATGFGESPGTVVKDVLRGRRGGTEAALLRILPDEFEPGLGVAFAFATDTRSGDVTYLPGVAVTTDSGPSSAPPTGTRRAPLW